MKRILAALARFIPARFRRRRRELTATERIMLKVTLEALRDHLTVTRAVSRAYEAEATGVKLGDTLNVKRPARFSPAQESK